MTGFRDRAYDILVSTSVIETPDMGDRYWTLGLLDAWTNPFAYVGRRTTDRVAGGKQEADDEQGSDGFHGLFLFSGKLPDVDEMAMDGGRGGHRLRRWRAWERERRLSLRPNLERRGATTSVGLTLRF